MTQHGEAERLAFNIYLRTGRRIELTGYEVKFNPWHDERDGRFTFSGQGKYFARGSGGGSFGGGGAGGSWGAPKPAKPPAEKQARAGSPQSAKPKPREQKRPELALRVLSPQPFKIHVRNGYSFAVDERGTPRNISGELKLAPAKRSRRAQAQAGGSDRLPSDDGGHYVGVRFGGPHDAFNHFAQDANFNRGAYRALEDQWAKAIKAGEHVTIDIVPHYPSGSQRPDSITVRYQIGNDAVSRTFPNDSKGKKHVSR